MLTKKDSYIKLCPTQLTNPLQVVTLCFDLAYAAYVVESNDTV